MNEPFNFQVHLKEIVKPVLSRFGFKIKGTKFVRQANYYDEVVYFQRSQYNRTGQENEFYLNIGVENKDLEILAYGRFNRPSKAMKPSFLAKIEEAEQIEQRVKCVAALSAEQKLQMREYHESRKWSYGSESQLEFLFKEATVLLNSQLETYLEYFKKNYPAVLKDPGKYFEYANRCYDNFITTWKSANV